MKGGFQIPTYTSKDVPIMIATMLPMTCLINYYLFGNTYFNDFPVFIKATLVTFFLVSSAFLTYGFVAISLRNRFPHDAQSFQRLFICITIFFLMSAVYMSLFLLGYDHFGFLGYEYSETDFLKCYFTLIVVNVFLTFLNEGVYRYEKYRDIITETEQLKKEYAQSQLLTLKSQMNPHFLFNGLNTLSSLIHEDAEAAESFLDHMSKVYRYLLRNHEEKLVPVETELHFMSSYFYLLQSRYGAALTVQVKIEDEQQKMKIPPLTLQMLVDHIINHNSFSRAKPLHIYIRNSGDQIEIVHNVQPKINGIKEGSEIIENISNKCRLLCQKEISIVESDTERTVSIPLISCKEEVVV